MQLLEVGMAKQYHCKRCRKVIGEIVEGPRGKVRLQTKDGYLIEGWAKVPCHHCGFSQSWVPGQKIKSEIQIEQPL
jgi:RNase P subunit RPR2